MPRPAFDLRTWPLPADSAALLPGAHRVWQQDGRILAEIALPDELADQAAAFTLHPVLVDTALRVLRSGATTDLPPAGGDPRDRDLSLCDGLAVYAEGAASLRLRITPARDGGHLLEFADQTGEPVAVLGPLTLAAGPGDAADVPAARDGPTPPLPMRGQRPTPSPGVRCREVKAPATRSPTGWPGCRPRSSTVW